MSTRTFTDEAGRRWTVWKVIPLSSERRLARRRIERPGLDGERQGLEPRSGEERRRDPSRTDAPERRSGVERRQEPDRRTLDDRRRGGDRRGRPRLKAQLPGDFAGGWLCFDAPGERRRLAPPPETWDEAGDEALREWLGRATPTRGIGAAPRAREGDAG